MTVEQQFTFRHHNRLTFPGKHLLICEDILDVQARLARHLCDVLEHEGPVMVSFAASAAQGAAIMQVPPGVHLIILDRDMPYGNGDDLLKWITSSGIQIPVITFSGIPANNDALVGLGAQYRFEKQQVIDGAADDLIKQILGVP